jgi:hypothetical protein
MAWQRSKSSRNAELIAFKSNAALGASFDSVQFKEAALDYGISWYVVSRRRLCVLRVSLPSLIWQSGAWV